MISISLFFWHFVGLFYSSSAGLYKLVVGSQPVTSDFVFNPNSPVKFIQVRIAFQMDAQELTIYELEIY